ncbi:hypothetical protein A0H76_668 [Hepatospora eriocheir]|uniref:Uncharacterized protein n=1 Tax=Hepatospora eriocheir TaxID=1081669 RepID=A0A1X0QL74_9MICR|nr:hypothetical protein A0H76_668 [Hepatospora eriocheir]
MLRIVKLINKDDFQKVDEITIEDSFNLVMLNNYVNHINNDKYQYVFYYNDEVIYNLDKLTEEDTNEVYYTIKDNINKPLIELDDCIVKLKVVNDNILSKTYSNKIYKNERCVFDSFTKLGLLFKINKELVFINKNKIINHLGELIIENDSLIEDVFVCGDNLVFLSNNLIKYFEDKQFIFELEVKNISFLTLSETHIVYIENKNKIMRFNIRKRTFSNFLIPFDIVVTCINVIKNIIYLGTSKSKIIIIKGSELHIEKINIRFATLLREYGEYLLIGSFNNLYWFDKNDLKKETYIKSFDNQINDICYYDNQLYVGVDRRIFKINL